MTRKDKYYRRGLLFLAFLFCLQSILFVFVYSRIRAERKKIESSARLLATSVDSVSDVVSRAETLFPSSVSSSPSVPSVVFPYDVVIGSGRTKSSRGRVMLYNDVRTYYTNGVFSTRRDYIPTPFFKTNGLPARGSAREAV